MKRIPLSGKNGAGLYAIVDDDDYEELAKTPWYTMTGYAKNKHGLMHRIITKCPPELIVDHKNRNRLDNRSSNLRICTQTENSRNRTASDTTYTGYKGVSRESSHRYAVHIVINGVRCRIGTYPSDTSAALAYNDAATKIFGEFAAHNEVRP